MAVKIKWQLICEAFFKKCSERGGTEIYDCGTEPNRYYPFAPIHYSSTWDRNFFIRVHRHVHPSVLSCAN